MDDSDKLDQIGRAMQAAWTRVKKAQTRMWGEWMVIGEGLLEGRRWAMHIAGVNRPEGKGFVVAFSEWLHRYRVDDMHKADRELMEERPAVEEWRMTLPDYDRRNLNHPTVVWRKWTAATRVKKPKPRSAGVSATEHGRAQRTVEELQARVDELNEELAAGRDTSLEPLLREAAQFIAASYKAQGCSAADMKKDMSPELFAYAKPELARLYAETTKSAKAEQSVVDELFSPLFEPTTRRKREE